MRARLDGKTGSTYRTHGTHAQRKKAKQTKREATIAKPGRIYCYYVCFGTIDSATSCRCTRPDRQALVFKTQANHVTRVLATEHTAAHETLHESDGLAVSTRILARTMRDAVRNKERWKRRRAPTQDPSTGVEDLHYPR